MCPYCKSTNIRKDANLSLVGDGGGIGVDYEKEGTMFYKTDIERMKIDFCLDCGTVVRFFLPNPKRKWLTK